MLIPVKRIYFDDTLPWLRTPVVEQGTWDTVTGAIYFTVEGEDHAAPFAKVREMEVAAPLPTYGTPEPTVARAAPSPPTVAVKVRKK